LNLPGIFYLDVIQEQRSTLFGQFKQAAGISSIPELPKYIYFLALANERFPVALLALQGRSQEGSVERRYANFALQAIEQGIIASQFIVSQELGRSSLVRSLSLRQRNWVTILAGGTVEGFRYPNFVALRRDNNTNLEGNHDFIQIFFPNREAGMCNRDLCVSNEIGNIFLESKIVWSNMRVVMILVCHRMFAFWGIGVILTGNGTIELIDSPSSVLHRKEDHNQLRFTRVIRSLGIMQCQVTLNLIRNLLHRNYRNVASYNTHWLRALEQEPLGMPEVSLQTLIQSYGGRFAE
jgi:hypothetical protein